MTRYRKKPVEVEAFRWDGTKDGYHEVLRFVGTPVGYQSENVYGKHEMRFLTLRTLEGTMYVSPGDFIIRGVKGELYPCKPDIFEATYEQVQHDQPR